MLCFLDWLMFMVLFLLSPIYLFHPFYLPMQSSLSDRSLQVVQIRPLQGKGTFFPTYQHSRIDIILDFLSSPYSCMCFLLNNLSIFSTKKTSISASLSFFCLATSYSHRGKPPTTIGAEELNFRVRNGNGCDLFAIVTKHIQEPCSFKTR